MSVGRHRRADAMSVDLATQHATLRKRIADQEGLELPRGVRARVYNSASISTTTAVAKTLTFDSERWDTDSLHDTGSNTSRLTIPFAGTYRVGGNLRFAANATGQRQARILLNNTTLLAVMTAPVSAAGATTDIIVTTDYQFVVGDYVELIAFQDSGGNLNVTAASNFSPEFWIEKLID